ncbi:hypothetical protein V8C43DRAFT_305540 [Trichoderma afarasin]
MPDSSTRVVHNGRNVSVETEVITSTTHSANDADPSYSLTRYLSDTSHHPPGHRQAQATAESETRLLGELLKFEAIFSLSRDALNRS